MADHPGIGESGDHMGRHSGHNAKEGVSESWGRRYSERITGKSSTDRIERNIVSRWGGPRTMSRKRQPRKQHNKPKTVLRLPDLDQAKSAALNSLTSADAQRGYRHAIDEFVDWYCSEPRLSFSRTVVLRYRMHLESRHLAPGTINLRLAPFAVWPTRLPTVGS